MRRARALTLVAGIAAALAVAVPTAGAHQTLVANGVAVTLHVAPNDEPLAGAPALVSITRIGTAKGTFTWKTCRCRMTIFEPGQAPLRSGKAVKKLHFTFPDAAAYGITVSGRVHRGKRWAQFKVTFGIRADPGPGATTTTTTTTDHD